MWLWKSACMLACPAVPVASILSFPYFLQSNPQRRGIKVFGGQPVKAGGIIYRQVGSTWHEGTNTGLGSDFTVYSKVDGIVVYDKKKVRPSVSA